MKEISVSADKMIKKQQVQRSVANCEPEYATVGQKIYNGHQSLQILKLFGYVK